MSSLSSDNKSLNNSQHRNNIGITEVNIDESSIQPADEKETNLVFDTSDLEGKDITGLDDATRLADDAKQIEITLEQDRKLVWKIDLCMFPLICLIYTVQFMDKVATGSAAIMRLRTDLKMHGNQYSWVGSTFYFGFLFMNLGPVQVLFQKSKYMSKMLAIFILIWGLLLFCHSAPHINYPGFIVLRVLLCCVERVVTPCFTIITAQYWKADEQSTRICIWFAMNGLGVIFLNAMAYGLYIHKDTYTIAAWRVLFIIIGVITLFLGSNLLLDSR